MEQERELQEELRDLERDLERHYSDMVAGRCEEIEEELAGIAMRLDFYRNDMDSPQAIDGPLGL
jgi:hypothetical protein